MANLTKEYTDIKNVKHNVEHLTISSHKDIGKEKIVEELLYILTEPRKHFLHKA